MNSKEIRWTKKKLLGSYQVGVRDFRQANLTGLSLRGEDLSGADFGGADIRSVDFTGAKLVGTNFCDTWMGGTRWSAFWAMVCCVVLAGFSTNTFLAVSKGYLFAGVDLLGIPTGFLWGSLAFEIIAYFTLTAFFILKSPQNKRLATSATVLIITLVASISIFMTRIASNLVGTLVAVMIGALFLGIWIAALMMKHYSKPGVDLVLLWFSAFAINLLLLPWALGAPGSDFISFLDLNFRLCLSGFLGCYFLAAAATTVKDNCKSERLNPALWVLMVIALLSGFLFNVWLKLNPLNAFNQYMVLSVGGSGLSSAILLATHLSLPGNLATGRFPWVFQRFTSFHQADLTDAAFSNVPDAIQARPSLIKPFHRYWYILSLMLSLVLFGVSVAQIELDTSSRAQLSPQLALNLLHNAASPQQRFLPLRRHTVQPDASETETKTTKAERLSMSPFGIRGNGIALNADGSMLAVGTTHSVLLWDLPSGKLIRRFDSHSDVNRALYFTADNRHLIDITYTITYAKGDTSEASIFDKPEEEKHEIFLWDIASGAQINKIDQVPPYGIKISGDVAFTFGGDPADPLDIYTGKSVQRFPGLAQIREKSGVVARAFYLSANQSVLIDLSQDVGSFATRGYADKVVTWDLQTGAQLNAFDPEGMGISTVSSSGRFFAIYYDHTKLSTINASQYFQAHPDSFIDIWDISTQSIVYTLPTLSGFESLLMSEDDNVLLGYGQNTFQVWDLQQDKTFLFPTVMPVADDNMGRESVAISHDGQVIATLSAVGEVAFVWHLR